MKLTSLRRQKVSIKSVNEYYLVHLVFTIACVVLILFVLALSSSHALETFTLNFAPAWNLINIPLKTNSHYTASQLMNGINREGGSCTVVRQWITGINGNWQDYTGPEDQDFILAEGAGYFVWCKYPSSLLLQGERIHSFSIPLSPGMNLLGPVKGETYLASEFLQEINGQGGTCSLVQDWVWGQWLPYSPIYGITDFWMQEGKAYFVWCESACDWSKVNTDGKPEFKDDCRFYIWESIPGQWHLYWTAGGNGECTFSGHLTTDGAFEASVVGFDGRESINVNGGNLSFSASESVGPVGIDFTTSGSKITIANLKIGDAINLQHINMGFGGDHPHSLPLSMRNTPGRAFVKIDLPDGNEYNPGNIFTAYPSNKFTAKITIATACDVYGAPFHVKFNPQVLKIERVEKGEFFSELDVDFEYFINNAQGELVIGLNRKGSVLGNNGDGLLVKVTFEALAIGGSALLFEEMELRNSNKSILPCSWINSRLSIGPPTSQPIKITGINDGQVYYYDPNGNIPNGIIFSDPLITIEGKVSEYSSSVTVNNRPVDTLANGYFSTQLPLNTLRCDDNLCENIIRVMDETNTISAPLVIYYSVQEGEFTITSPSQWQITKNSSITIKGTVQNIDYQVRVERENPCQIISATVFSNGEFEAQGLNLHEGENRIRITQVDLMGHELSKELVVQRDSRKPVIIVENPHIFSTINLDTSSSFTLAAMRNVVDRGDGHITLTPKAEKVWKSSWGATLSNFSINAIAMNNSRKMWFGAYGDALYPFDGVENWNRYDMQHGLVSNTINGLCFDDAGRLWIGTSHGIGMFDGQNWYRYAKVGDGRIECGRWDEGEETFIRHEIYGGISDKTFLRVKI